ncbi:MAG TPA: PLP-dependent aminotransferase family protein [Trebonia sp.]|jgi:DNA-binding transcriptional MocR family regulator|nr:PLP-dependent aminotransferase family protein [Trebonia sp.]
MDQSRPGERDLAWWAEAVFGGWRERPGPRYVRLAAALLEAIEQRTVRQGARVPAERSLAAVVGVSRGTVVACFDHLVAAGVLTRRQGAGTYVTGRPSWAASPAATSVATMLLRRVAADRETIDLSVSTPGDLRHLPSLGPETRTTEARAPVARFPDSLWQSLDGHGMDPAGLPSLREIVAGHLTRFQRLPTSPSQVVVTAGAQEALWLLTRTLPARRVLVTCPTYPGLAGTGVEIVPVPADGAGADSAALARAGRTGSAAAYLMPTGHNPAGTIMPLVRRQAIAALADAERVTVVEDLALADLVLGAVPGSPTPQAPPPLAALSQRAVAFGSASKVLWGGLRIGWIRADEPLRSALVARKAALNLGTSAVSQAVAAQLLGAITGDWLAAHRAALTQRRDHLTSLLSACLPAWRITPPAAGLSLWAELPVDSADAFIPVAARHGVTVMPGTSACADGLHRQFIRISFAEQPGTLELAAERLAAAWEVHAENLAASPA